MVEPHSWQRNTRSWVIVVVAWQSRQVIRAGIRLIFRREAAKAGEPFAVAQHADVQINHADRAALGGEVSDAENGTRQG